MICPKCNFDQPDGHDMCLNCGVIFAKLRPCLSQKTDEPAAYARHEEVWSDRQREKSLIDIPNEENTFVWAGRIILWLGLVVWGVKFMFTPVSGEGFNQSYMHLINLPFHEAGHVLFSIFGRLMQVLGGSLGQLLIPLIVSVSFLLRRDFFAMSVGLWWLGQSFMDIAPYIDDARAGQLMLLGGVTGSVVEDYHDWEIILTRLGLMSYDHIFARISFGFGVIIMLMALVLGGYVLYCQKRKV
jgi:hypothetical protein